MAIAPPTNPLLAVPLFARLSPDVLELFMAHSWTRHYPRGQILVTQGDQCEEFKLLEAGRVRFSRFDYDGHEVVIGARGAPTVLGELTLFDGAPCSVTILADTEIDLRLFELRYVRSVIERHPEAAMAMLHTLTGMVRETNERLADIMTLDAPGRLAKWLLSRSTREDQVTIEQSQEALALYLGTTRVTVNRTLRRFVHLGLIEMHGREVVIRNRVGLTALMTGWWSRPERRGGGS